MSRSTGVRVGLCSVTFRRMTAAALVEAAVDAGLESIEWGADIHAPVGDLDLARYVGEITRDAGLAVSSYGAYFRCEQRSGIAPLLKAARALGAPRIRVWAGDCGSAVASAVERERTISVLRELVHEAHAVGIEIALEFHRGTLMDDRESALRVLAAVPGVSAYWQPAVGASDGEALADLFALGERASSLHVFSWAPDGRRLLLKERSALWRRVLGDVAAFSAVTDLLLEFVPDDDPGLLVGEAAQLRQWRDELFPPQR